MAWYYSAAMIALFAVFVLGVVLVLKYAVVKPRIRTLLLDVDGTLLDFDRCEAAAVQEAFAELGLPFDPSVCDVYHRNNRACWEALERGELTREELKVRRFRETFRELGLDADPAAVTKVYEKKLGQHAFPYPGAEETCRSLSKRYAVYIVTNGLKNVQASRLIQTSIPETVKGIFISEDVGFAKPSPEFFHGVFSAIPKCKREETLIVGDSLSGDILGGNNAGIRTCWVNRKGDPRPEHLRIDYEISDITELERVL